MKWKGLAGCMLIVWHYSLKCWQKIKVKLELSLCMPWKHIGGVEVQLQHFLNSALDVRWVVSFTCWMLHRRKMASRYPLGERLDGSESRSGSCEEHKNPFTCLSPVSIPITPPDLPDVWWKMVQTPAHIVQLCFVSAPEKKNRDWRINQGALVYCRCSYVLVCALTIESFKKTPCSFSMFQYVILFAFNK
jgi:hypothetical protein